jgi:hypothetical protein
MTAHTPGPWACTYTSNHAHDYRLTQANGQPLPINAPANDRSEQRANARLIAEAPALLALCERSFRALNWDDFPQLKEDLQNAIEKATP